MNLSNSQQRWRENSGLTTLFGERQNRAGNLHFDKKPAKGVVCPLEMVVYRLDLGGIVLMKIFEGELACMLANKPIANMLVYLK